MDRIDNIINEEINKTLITEGLLDSLRNLLRDFKRHKDRHKKDDGRINNKKTKEELRKERKARKEDDKDKKDKKKIRKMVKGASQYYNYDEYQKTHRKLSKGDTESIIDSIDQENTNIAAIARELFPDHTSEGAQSQLRKILNHERPLTKDIAEKLKKMISSGKIAVK